MAIDLTSQALRGRLASTQQLRQRLEIFLAHGPAYHYVYGRWRWARWRSAQRPPAPRLSDSQFWHALDLDQAGLASLRLAVAAADEPLARARLADHFRARVQPRWFFAPDDLPAIARLVPAELKAATLRQADAVCQNIFQFRHAAPVQFGAQVDWSCQPDGNVDWHWDLHRHLYFDTLGRAHVYSGDGRYARKFCELLLDWTARNPPSVRSPAWSSIFEVAFRINTWLWALFYFRQAAAFDDTACRVLLEGLLRHGQMLDDHIELHAANNHLLLEAKALALLGLALPEFRQAARWRQRGLALLYREARAQITADGVHTERVAHYQHVAAGELLELCVWLANNGVPAPADLTERLSQMVTFEQWLTKPDGQMPLFGDSGLEDSHAGYAVTAAGPAFLGQPDMKRPDAELTEADYWLLGPERVERYRAWLAATGALPSRAFPEGGYAVMRAGSGPQSAYLAFDAAPFGDRRVPGHGHADALSFELYAHGQTWLMDPGVYGTWVPPEWRNYFRGTRAHNTVLVDEQDQSLLIGTRLVYHPVRDGRRRQVLFVKPSYWVVFDWLEGAGEHTVDWLFHFTPGQAVQLGANGRAWAGAPGSPSLTVLPVGSHELEADIMGGATEPIQGWAAPYSGEKEPAPVLRYRQQGQAPFELCTVLLAAPAGSPAAIAARLLTVQPAAGATALPAGQVTGLIVETEQFRDLIVIDRGTPPALKSYVGQTSPAGLIYLRQRLNGNETVLKVEL